MLNRRSCYQGSRRHLHASGISYTKKRQRLRVDSVYPAQTGVAAGGNNKAWMILKNRPR
jgi:hypothetical protein